MSAIENFLKAIILTAVFWDTRTHIDKLKRKILDNNLRIAWQFGFLFVLLPHLPLQVVGAKVLL
jgi:hypothetical protein